MKFKITTYLIILSLIMAGCGSVQKKTGREYILNNPLLDEQDRGFAIRLYDFLISDDAEVLREEISEDNIDADFLEMDIYKKWGLGKKTDFTEHQKNDIIILSDCVDLWGKYKNLDMAKISSYDKEYLEELHSEYGEGPIDLRQVELDELPETEDTLVYLAEILCGSRYIDDRSIAAIRYWMGPIESDPIP